MTRKGNDGQVGNSSISGAQQCIHFALRRLGWNLFYQFRLQGFLEMADDRTGSVRDVCSRLVSQSIAINEQFLCGYRLVIDWPIPIDTNQLILSIDID